MQTTACARTWADTERYGRAWSFLHLALGLIQMPSVLMERWLIKMRLMPGLLPLTRCVGNVIATPSAVTHSRLIGSTIFTLVCAWQQADAYLPHLCDLQEDSSPALGEEPLHLRPHVPAQGHVKRPGEERGAGGAKGRRDGEGRGGGGKEREGDWERKWSGKCSKGQERRRAVQ